MASDPDFKFELGSCVYHVTNDSVKMAIAHRFTDTHGYLCYDCSWLDANHHQQGGSFEEHVLKSCD